MRLKVSRILCFAIAFFGIQLQMAWAADGYLPIRLIRGREVSLATALKLVDLAKQKERLDKESELLNLGVL